ncbi:MULTISPECIES: glycoside hydrolase family 127 protein [unclassified Mesorhizobium]|uniref:glycoside hydrolase family 127 protein n=1 Tax=unclassified Mesorhizobium TaxID=325217 RepID=UPI000FD8411C|nr:MULTISPECIES: glycoside hydrolase family 127 protein [unclassified Mesorhizobium]TGR47366.1 glycoside hydrolase family 127 protein [bacterium M00.F.Ca.ET.199.01.1.1]TGU36819.1 glycoside hydrolase family 127 protein [bacterium M00.F.Ca.ET.156.01.1.1]TGV88007.1 glycoside hydrolase family 127 protein [Mesorhizobium sp. M00.F.Ca.ET.149.01.1.1]TGR29079.1 glycoside hydrolase family 127 protein [Mesorhizobium sp. M8A.F.Ca.ET.202.01.1.1]TGR29695.1 glycoside hydrolase family 127 protein [Mesorhizobi
MTASPSPRPATTARPKLAFRPLPVPQVDVRGFWGDRAEAVATRTADILYDRCVEARMLEQIDPDRPSPGIVIPFHSPSPDEAASPGFTGSTVTTQMFWDSDLGKTIETSAYSLYRRKNPELEKKIDAVIDMYGRLQQEDGYLSSWYQRIQPGKRWTNLRDCHELYCAGHLIEGAVAYYQATGKRKLLDIMCRYADHIASVLGPEPGKKKGYCGHEEIELALVKLARVTGERKYMELAKYFIDQRGLEPHYFDEEARARGADPKAYHFKTYEYSQSHIPVREQDKVVGHAVRAMYLYSGMADIATEYGDDTLRVALDRLWDDLTTKNLYITGGLGPSAHNEGFTSDYDLPNETAYAETCASVGLVFWASRMLGMGPNARYADMMERALYNGSISGLSLDGSLFFYENPLESRGKHNRWKWHRCPCCPPNIGRMVASIGSYFYSLSDDALAVHLYGDSTARFDIAGVPVTLTQASRYPWDGSVEITVEPQAPVEFTLHLRVPGWSSRAGLAVNGETVDIEDVTSDGYAAIRRNWKKGDRVRLDLEMPIERLYANPEVRQDAGRVALSRGPLIYCVEATDNDTSLHRLTLPRTAGIEVHDEPDLLGGVVTLAATAQADAGDGWQDGLYRSEPPAKVETRLTAIPYFAWDNREPGEMLVWLRDG